MSVTESMQDTKPFSAVALLLTAALVLIPVTPACALPPPFEAKYAVRSHGFKVGEMVMRLVRDGDLLKLQTRTNATGLLAVFVGDSTVTERSLLRDGAERLELVGFEFRSSVPDKERELQGRWDPERERLEIVDGQRSVSLEAPPGSLDRLGVQLLVMDALERGQQSGTISVVDLDELKSVSYRVVEEERVETGIGKRRSLRVRRVEPGSKWINEGWYAPELGFVPVKMEQRKKDGKPTRLVLRSLRWLER
jgi:hypothetical protein